MKILLKFITVAIFLVFLQEIGMAQSLDDQSKVLQKCIDQMEMQPYYPLDATGNPDQLYMMQYAVAFPVGINVSKSGKAVLFMSREEIILDWSVIIIKIEGDIK